MSLMEPIPPIGSHSLGQSGRCGWLLKRRRVIKPHAPWRIVEQVEIATPRVRRLVQSLRLFEACGHIPPADLEQAHYRRQQAVGTDDDHSTR